MRRLSSAGHIAKVVLVSSPTQKGDVGSLMTLIAVGRRFLTEAVGMAGGRSTAFTLLCGLNVCDAWLSASPRASTPHVRAARPSLSRRTLIAAAQEQGDGDGPLSALRAKLPPTPELKKVVPLGLMFFCILFSYTILRDTKDVLVITAPGSGAEIIPFLKTYVNLPGAIGFTALYSYLTNNYSREKVFFGIITVFLAFFALFAIVVYPNAALLHPTGFCTWLAAQLPAGFAAPIAILRNWTYAVFYTMAELWGSGTPWPLEPWPRRTLRTPSQQAPCSDHASVVHVAQWWSRCSFGVGPTR